ncbi:MAG: GntR family transcriptional regulator [Anaerolineales bacterium]|nr:GntR family transcriptional regulator [Anaerolineales bacterium]
MSETIHTGTRSQQVKEYVLHYISQNHLKQNDQLPSEAAIAKTLGVSRNTIREAYISLENEGIIVRRHGIGTFVAHSPFIRDSLNEFSPFAQIIHEGGYIPHFETLSMSVELVPNEVSDALHCSPAEKLRRINRLVLADQLPAIYVEDYLALLVEEADLPWGFFKGNMVQFLNASLEPSLHQIRSQIRAAATPPEISAYMKIPEGTPVLSVRSTIYNLDNRPVNYSRIYFNSNIVELSTVRMIRSI